MAIWLKAILKVAFILCSHLYMVWNLSYIEFFRKIKHQALITLIGTCIVSVILLHSTVPDYQPFRVIYYAFMLWYGIVITTCMSALLFHVLQILRIISEKYKAVCIIAFGILLFIVGLTNASVIRIESIDIKLKGNILKTPIRIAHLTDIHLGSAYRQPYLELICDKLKDLEPDIIVITGDLYDGNIHYEYQQIKLLDQLGIPTYFIAGNHDLFHEGEIADVMKQSNITYLSNSAIVYKDMLQFVGFDYNEKINLTKAMSKLQLKDNLVNILLYHSPMFDMDLLAKQNISIQLTGHTHGGQILPVRLLQMLTYKYLKGLYSSNDGNTYIYVSQGVGTTGTPIRIGTKPTIALITLSNDSN